MAAEVFRVRCMRCGDDYECNLLETHFLEICRDCASKALEALDRDLNNNLRTNFFGRFMDRYRKGAAKHPTWKRVTAAWEAWATPSDSAEAPF